MALNKQKFNHVLANSHDISASDREDIHELVKEYPYSQILHTLLAKANLDAKTSIAQSTLSYAAMYATDRQVLRAFVQGNAQQNITKLPVPDESRISDDTQKKVTEAPKSPSNVEPTLKINQQPQVKITVDDAKMKEMRGSLRDETWADLKELKTSKANFMKWLDSPDEVKTIKKAEVHSKETQPTAPKKKTATKTKKSTPKASAKPETKKVSADKKTIARKAIPAKKATTAKKVSTTKKKVVKEKVLKTSKSTAKKNPVKKKPEIKKAVANKAPLKEQIKIINEFIDKRPSIISKPITKTIGDQADLSIASTQFDENLVSENLALIFIDQGKTEKAIDIYKKLIWKFPQKKAYFAAQIEALTK